MRPLVTACLGFVLGLLPDLCFGHEIRPAFLQINALEDGGGPRFEASFRQPQVSGRYLGLSVISNCESTPLAARVSDAALTESFLLECGQEGLTEIQIAGLERTMIDTLLSVSYADGSRLESLITAQQPRLDLTDSAPAVPVYLAIGIDHLLFGYDHILFVIMLLYLVRTPLAIVKVVTSFTIAHSITLALSAVDLVRLSQAPIEAVIAASIVLLAYENLRESRSVSHHFPVLVAFGFGLLHGLGFAGALAEIGLPESNRIMALFLFNVGIELGQLAIVAAVLLPLALFRPRLSPALVNAPLYLAGGIASYWFLQRAWTIVTPVFV